MIKTLADARRELQKRGIGSLVTRQEGNAKLSKAKTTLYYNCGISFAQASTSGRNVCSSSTPQCRKVCLGGVGRAEMFDKIPKTRVLRTNFFFEDRKLFWECLRQELLSIDRYCERSQLEVAFRPNILSDLPWPDLMPQLFEEFPFWQFYGYTKVMPQIRKFIAGKLPSNYHLTYSWSERCTQSRLDELLSNGVNVAVPMFNLDSSGGVVRKGWTLPKKFKGWPVIDGDENDLRFLDPQGVVVGLRAKLPLSNKKSAQQIKFANGFFQKV